MKKPLKVEQWLKELKHSPKTKSNIKGLLHRIFEYAMKWEILETQRNPMQFVEIKGVTKRVRKKVLLQLSNIRLFSQSSVPHSSDGHDCNVPGLAHQ